MVLIEGKKKKRRPCAEKGKDHLVIILLQCKAQKEVKTLVVKACTREGVKDKRRCLAIKYLFVCLSLALLL